jgi:hypothetical protein
MDVLARIPVPSQGTRSAAFTTQVAGNCGGAGCPPSGHEGAGNIIFAAGDLSWTGYLQPLGVTAAYTASWAGPDFATGKLFALYWACPTSCQTNAPDSYWYAVQDAVTLRVGVTTDVPPLALAPAPTAQLAVNVSAPAGLSPEANVGFAFGGSRTYWWSPAGLAPVGVNSVLLPVLADLRSMVTIEAHPLSGGWTYAGWIGTTPAATPVDLALHEVPSLVEPPDGASGVGPGTRFSWSGATGTLHLPDLWSTAGAPHFRVTTASPSFDVPDLVSLGVVVPTGTSYHWTVRALSTSDVNALLAPGTRSTRGTLTYFTDPTSEAWLEMTTKAPETTELADRIFDFMAIVVDCLDNTSYANDRPVYTQDLALAARWLVRLHRGEPVRDVARAVSSPATGKMLTDYYRSGNWGERHNAAAVALQKAASTLVT